MKKTIVFAALLFLAGCIHDAQETESAGNGIKLELLFEKDGCKMYRFHDGRTVYWASCGGSTYYEYTTKSGKSHRTHSVDSITTEQP